MFSGCNAFHCLLTHSAKPCYPKGLAVLIKWSKCTVVSVKHMAVEDASSPHSGIHPLYLCWVCPAVVTFFEEAGCCSILLLKFCLSLWKRTLSIKQLFVFPKLWMSFINLSQLQIVFCMSIFPGFTASPCLCLSLACSWSHNSTHLLHFAHLQSANQFSVLFTPAPTQPQNFVLNISHIQAPVLCFPVISCVSSINTWLHTYRRQLFSAGTEVLSNIFPEDSLNITQGQ